ncbi:MAG TPA: protein kinase [Gemmatimonadaceae bacterium]|nr:protein kinase [Gemmatimonadaceae bacterium]
MTQQTDRLNTALAGRYRIERHLGEGGMASVYLCEDLKHDRHVALKLLKPELSAVLGGDRFVQEIKTTAALQHPHILPLFDSGVADGFLFYVMPFIDGETLRDKLNRETQLSIDEALRIARELLDALQYAHEHGIVHRDVKPENILLHGGHAMIADFGIALAVSAAAGGRMTETGLSLGTPHYMSPEQATAEKEITARSDVYSVASVLYEMLAGQPPHVGGPAQQVIMRIITERARPVSELRKNVPPNVVAAIEKALEKLPADRFDSARAFSEALGNTGFTTARVGAEAASGSTRKGGLFTPLFVGVLAVATLAIAAAVWGWMRPTAQPVVRRYRTMLWNTAQVPLGLVVRRVGISPEGGTIAFVDSTGSGRRLFAKQRDQLEPTVLTGTDDAAGGVRFSPDGAWIGFITSEGQVKKVPRGGGASVVLADSAFPAAASTLAWLDDGTILYIDPGFGVRAVRQDGSNPRVVLHVPVTTDTATRGTVSVAGLPGGTRALIVTCNAGCVRSELRVLDVRTAKSTVVMSDILAAWSLPGGIVAVVRKDGNVLAGPFDAGTARFTRPPSPVLDGVRIPNCCSADAAMSANGTLLYVVGVAQSQVRRYQPVWVTRAGAVTPIDSTWTIPVSSDCTCSGDLSLSPDGHRLALTIERRPPSGNGDIFVKQLNAAPYALMPLTFAGDGTSPQWTADGQSIVYGADKGDNDAASWLVRRRADGTGAVDTLLPTRPRAIIKVVPTPDTTQFILQYDINGALRDIVLAHRGDTTATPLMADPKHAEIFPALSPDGRWIAYASDESGQFEVYVRPFPNVNAQRVQVSQSGGTEPRWSRDGRTLYYRTKAGAFMAASVVAGPSFTLGTQTKLFDASSFYYGESSRNYDVTPDGKRFVFLRKLQDVQPTNPSPDKLVEVENWAAEVKAKLSGKAAR